MPRAGSTLPEHSVQTEARCVRLNRWSWEVGTTGLHITGRNPGVVGLEELELRSKLRSDALPVTSIDFSG